MSNYKDLQVWKCAYELAQRIYVISKKLPKEEKYELSSQIRRAAISIPSNIAEGYRRRHFGSQLQFALIAYGSASEQETQLLLISDFDMLDNVVVRETSNELEHVLRLLNGYCSYLRHQRQKGTIV